MSNRKKDLTSFRKNSHGLNILDKLSLCVEFPYQSLDLLGDEQTVRRVVRNMEKDSVVSITQNAELKTVRILKKGVEKIEELFPKSTMDYYMKVSDNRNFRGGETRIWRNHRNAESTLFLASNGVEVRDVDKPSIQVHSDSHKTPYFDDKSFYYLSTEFKSLDTEQLYKIAYTRVQGLLVSPRGPYCVYNTNKSAIKWSNQGEHKVQLYLKRVMDNSFELSEPAKLDSAIIFGKGYDAAIKIFENKRKKVDDQYELLSFEQTYDQIYYLPFDENGSYQLKLLMSDKWESILYNNMIPKTFETNKANMMVDCHAFDKEKNKYILFFLEGDMKQLIKFIGASEFYSDVTFEIFCFSWQKEFLEHVNSRKNVTIKVIDEKSILNAL